MATALSLNKDTLAATFSGNLLAASNNTLNIGSSSNKFANIYATNFNGNLKGNADTATKATQDSDGNQINSTYTKIDSSARRIDLGGINDYERVVIALCCTTNASNFGNHHYSSGKIDRMRSNALVPNYYADVMISDSYFVANGCYCSLMTNYENTSTESRGIFEGYRPCVFTYNGITYAGLEFYQTQAASFTWTGISEPKSFVPFKVDIIILTLKLL